MARPLRIEYPGAYYHVMNRGNSKQDIFITDGNRATFLRALDDSSQIYDVRVICYVLMSNHFHLIVKTNLANLSEFMRHFLVTYTVRFNRRQKKTGHLFQGRYKSLLVEEDEYLLPLSRYIHLNPVRDKGPESEDAKGLRKYLQGYRWSSFPGYSSTRNRLKWIDYGWLLKAYFGGDNTRGRARYRSFVYSGIDGEIENPFENVVHQSILGTNGFVEWVKGEVSLEPDREVPAIRNLRRSVAAEELLRVIASWYGIESKEILERKRQVAEIRQVAMELCYRYCPMTQRDIGDLFGVDYSTVSQNRRRLKLRMASDKKLKKQFEELKGRIEQLSKQKI
jgi:REP element-mobilizing transposase RayT